MAGSGQEISGQLCRPAFGKFFLQVTKNNCTTKGLKGMENNEKYLVQQGESKKRSPIIKAFSNFLIFLLNSDSDRVTLRRLRQWVRVIQKSSSISPLWSASRISQSSSASILSMLMHSLRNLSNFQHLPTSVSKQLQQLSCNLMQLPQRQQFILHSFYLNGLLDKSTATSSRKLLIPASPAPEYEVASNCHCHCRAVQAVQYPVPRSGNRVCTLMLETCTLKSSNLATNPPQKYIAQLHNIHQ